MLTGVKNISSFSPAVILLLHSSGVNQGSGTSQSCLRQSLLVLAGSEAPMFSEVVVESNTHRNKLRISRIPTRMSSCLHSCLSRLGGLGPGGKSQSPFHCPEMHCSTFIHGMSSCIRDSAFIKYTLELLTHMTTHHLSYWACAHSSALPLMRLVIDFFTRILGIGSMQLLEINIYWVRKLFV